MLFRSVQGAFVTDKEVSDVVEYIIEKNGQVAYNAEVEEKVNTSENSILKRMVLNMSQKKRRGLLKNPR